MRPGIPGRRRGDRSADGGLKDLAKLAMTISGTVNWAKGLFFFFVLAGGVVWLRGSKMARNGDGKRLGDFWQDVLYPRQFNDAFDRLCMHGKVEKWLQFRG